MIPAGRHTERHRSDRVGWLRAGVLGANDGLLSVASLVMGVAAANNTTSAVLIAGLAALAAGAFAMAVGEYSSVSSQLDTERSDLERERGELAAHPEAEVAELAAIYVRRGIPPELADQVARHLTADDALHAHARDELGLNPAELARPIQAALVSAGSFTLGAVLPLVSAVFLPAHLRIPVTIALTVIALGVLGVIGAQLGNAPKWRAATRLVVGGSAALAVTTGIGAITGGAVS
jgi:VIT1/CCC1 family predicted Fe2+/Mn2+ transporter